MNPVMEQLPESKRTSDVEAALTGLGINDMGSLADVLVSSFTQKGEAETMKGQLGDLKNQMVGMVKLPGDDASDEVRIAFNSTIGVPGSITDYGLTTLEATDAGKAMLSAFVESGVRKDVATKLVGKLDTMNQSVLTKKSEANAARLTEVKSSLGDKGFDLAKKGAEILYPGDELASIRERYLNDPDAVSGMANIGRLAIETPRIFQTPAKGSGGDLYPGMTNRGMK